MAMFCLFNFFCQSSQIIEASGQESVVFTTVALVPRTKHVTSWGWLFTRSTGICSALLWFEHNREHETQVRQATNKGTDQDVRR